MERMCEFKKKKCVLTIKNKQLLLVKQRSSHFPHVETFPDPFIT